MNTTHTTTNIHTRGAENLRLEISSVWSDKALPCSLHLLQGTELPTLTLFVNEGYELNSLIKSMEKIIEQVKNDPKLSLHIMTDKVGV